MKQQSNPVISHAYGQKLDPQQCQQLAEEVLKILAEGDDRVVETKLLVYLQLDKFNLIKYLVWNRLKLHATRATAKENQKILDKSIREEASLVLLKDESGRDGDRERRGFSDRDGAGGWLKGLGQLLDLDSLAFEQRGKTNLAVLTILQQLAKHMNSDGSINHRNYKIIYVAPMKALVAGNLSHRLESYGVIARELSGDQNLTRQQVDETQIIVTTPEKWDIVTGKSGDCTYTQLVKLLIIDEIHLHDNRGPILESIIAWTVWQIETTKEHIRLVLAVAGKHQVLIFVHSRKETFKTARAARDTALANDTLSRFLKEDAASRLIAKLLKNSLLMDMYRCWCRLGCELACSYSHYLGNPNLSPENGEWTELCPLDVMQMLGRAGRPQYDSYGEGIIITGHS
ncbi:hypothetical protein F3Y22_tig00110610pilonHSYRG00935 [Hibiscus syriacus]|uniref:Helicase ATP-binding domain-containing protein n=1 Tax=Hibiscus syriacus TaxID=106335 RepID=A0A6A3A3L5_HIBSY|nr:hypothetical protein F3Y22_tig00110610pilonHSYRG00935 [Hibiscus syriacus]